MGDNERINSAILSCKLGIPGIPGIPLLALDVAPLLLLDDDEADDGA